MVLIIWHFKYKFVEYNYIKSFLYNCSKFFKVIKSLSFGAERPLIESQTQHPEAMEQIGYLEDQSRFQRTISIEECSTIKPTFVKPLTNLGEVLEGKYAHFEGQLHPVSDPFMRIEWFKDGKHITASKSTTLQTF